MNDNMVASERVEFLNTCSTQTLTGLLPCPWPEGSSIPEEISTLLDARKRGEASEPPAVDGEDDWVEEGSMLYGPRWA